MSTTKTVTIAYLGTIDDASLEDEYIGNRMKS